MQKIEHAIKKKTLNMYVSLITHKRACKKENCYYVLDFISCGYFNVLVVLVAMTV